MAHDLPNLYADLQHLTVDRLKTVIRRINDSGVLSLKLRLSGSKQELYDRVKSEAFHCAQTNTPDSLAKLGVIRRIVTEVHSGAASPSASSTSSYGGGGSYSFGGYGGGASGSNAHYPYGQTLQQQAAAAAAAQQRSNLPPPRFGGVSGTSQHWSSASPHPTPQPTTTITGGLPISFRKSPFYAPEKSLCSLQTLQRAGQGDRRSMVFDFHYSAAQHDLLTAARASKDNAQYQVRLYCTSEDHYAPNRHASFVPTDFPASLEIKLNGLPVQANTKGIKKVPGSAPPVDLFNASGGKAFKLGVGMSNRVEIVYMNTDKRYFVVVYLVKTTTVKQVVEKVKAGHLKPKESVIASIIKLNSDPDVVATSQGLPLKDPVSFVSSTTHQKPSKTHIGCFDAETWFMMMEQTPSWACPICSKTLQVDQIVVDGYTEDILKTCPSSVDGVTVNPDGTWRSDDDKYGTAPPKTSSTPQSGTPLPDLKGKGKAVDQSQSQLQGELMLLSDDDDEPVPQRRVVSLGSSPDGPPLAAGKKAAEVIDLTLSDSEDEEDVQPVIKKSLFPKEVPRRSESVVAGGSGGLNGGPPTLKRSAESEEEMRKRLREER
ncbi:zinc finger, MIZ-type protein [Pseudohyphozyma bogoriensis]|nr:zinc finger, MIZ-type protein [Pseudohyphozyma bogoriensis]